jgi:predicted MFS family arabinose efflux permease
VGRYRTILRTPRVALLISATLMGRLPFAINALAVLLFVRDVSGSFAGAGVVSGALALGSAVGAPLQGRLVDRRGEGMLMTLACVHAASLLAIWSLGEAGASVAVLAALALLAGVAFPPTGSVLRSRWPQLVGDRPDLIRSAYAFDSVMIETAFVAGPLVTALGVALLAPEAMLGLSAGLMLAGTALFVAALPATDARPQDAGGGGLWGALSSPGIRTVALASFPVGFCFGTIEVGLPAFSHEHGSDELAGVLLAIWSAGSLVGGFLYGARPPRAPLLDVHTRLALLLPLACLPLVASGSPISMAVLVALAGAPVAPLIASRNELVSAIAPRGAQTEAFTWPLTALVAGLSVGAATAGLLVDASGWETAMLVGAVTAGLGALLVVSRRETLVVAPSPA